VLTINEQGGVTFDLGGIQLTGPFNGTVLSLTGSYPEDEGTTTITGMRLVLDAQGTVFRGTSSWSWTDDEDDCTGTDTITATKR
jgi:hypothetical protein